MIGISVLAAFIFRCSIDLLYYMLAEQLRPHIWPIMIQLLPMPSTPLILCSYALPFIANFSITGWPVLSEKTAHLSVLSTMYFLFFFSREVPLFFWQLVLSLIIVSKAGPTSCSLDSIIFISFLALTTGCIDFHYLFIYCLFPHLLRKFFKHSHLVYLVHCIFNTVPSVQKVFKIRE